MNWRKWVLQTFLQMFQRGIYKKNCIHFQLELGTYVNPETGFYEKEHLEWMSDFHFYPVSKGDLIICSNLDYCYGIASYSNNVEQNLVYTYCYQKEENWSCYRKDFDVERLYQGKYVVPGDGWIRIVIRRKDKEVLTHKDMIAIQETLALQCRKREYQKKVYFEFEIEDTIQKVNNKKKENSLVLGLMTDSHYVINGGWEDTAYNLQAVNSGVKFDAMIHLGDLTDGMVPLSVTKEYVSKVMQDLEQTGAPVYLALGNHDSNYFHKNPEWMREEEQSEFYLNRQKPWYFVDFEKQKVRCIFLYSFNHKEKIRYGFPMEEVEWVKDILANTPENMKIIVFSHVPLLPKMHFWSKEIRNSSEMLQVLEDYVQQGGTILSYIHGHNHADQICHDRNFPIVSIGCAKCEDFKDKKPEGSITYDRKEGTVSQELWDVMIVNADENRLEFVRFGAGEDRSL